MNTATPAFPARQKITRDDFRAYSTAHTALVRAEQMRTAAQFATMCQAEPRLIRILRASMRQWSTWAAADARFYVHHLKKA